MMMWVGYLTVCWQPMAREIMIGHEVGPPYVLLRFEN